MIFTIFKKELIDTLRDRRTLIAMIIVPALLFPIIFKITNSFTQNITKEASNKKMKVAVIGKQNSLFNHLKNDIKDADKYDWVSYKDSTQIVQDIREDKVDVGLFFQSNFDNIIQQNKSAQVTIYYDETDIGYKERMSALIEAFNQQVSAQRLDSLNIDKALFNAIIIKDANVASTQKIIGKMAGGILPYIFIIFGFIGCMYPAIDLFTGEKERGTIETLLTTPLSRWKILVGKMGVVVLSGVLAASFALGGLFYSLQGLPSGEEMSELNLVMGSFFTINNIISMFALIIPLVIFFAGVMIPVAVYAKTFKEAQSIITPLNILILVPAMLGMMPVIEYTFSTAFIPILNVVLATKEIMAGTIDYTLYTCSLTSLILLAGIAVYLSHKKFGSETNVSAV